MKKTIVLLLSLCQIIDDEENKNVFVILY